MKVKLLTNIKENGVMVHFPLDIVDLPTEKAEYMISRGQAIKVKEPKPESKPPVESVKTVTGPSGVAKK